jgi:phasin
MDEHLKMEMPHEIREIAERTIDQAETGFSAFIDAATRSVSTFPSPATDLPLKALSISERNMKAAFDHARKLLHAKNIQDAMRLQADFLKAQYEAATEQLRELSSGVRTPTENLSKTSVEIK